MSVTTEPVVPLSNTDRFFIGGEWAKPSSDAVFNVIDSATEQTYFQVPEAQPADMDLAIGAARSSVPHGAVAEDDTRRTRRVSARDG